MSDLRDKRVDLILQQLEQLPTLPAVAIKLLEITADETSSSGEVVELLESDQSLATLILKIVHRADLGVRGQVDSIGRAVALLGFEAIRSAVLSLSVFQTFSTKNEASNFSRDDFWKHAVAVACCAELLAAGSRDVPGVTRIEAPEAFICGLLHDLGKVALDAVLPKSFSRVVEATDLLRNNIADLERQVIGLDHMVVGKRLAERWQLPVNVRDCIWLHGQTPEALPATVRNARLVNLITLADTLVREQHIGYSGNYTFSISRQALLVATGISESIIQTSLEHLMAQVEPRAAALGLGNASSAELYVQALSNANKELSRVSMQLSTKNKKLAIRAKFFDALAGFHSELRPDAPISTVLQAIGQTAVGVLGVSSACAFSLAPTADFAEVLLFDDAGEIFDTSLVDCAARPPKPPAGDGPVLAAGEEMEWLLSAISPRLGRDNRYWMILEADGICIGGVVWGAYTGEAQRLSPQVQELSAIANGWGLALRTAQIREESNKLSEQLAEANRQLQSAQTEILRGRTLITVGEMAAGAAHEMNNPLAVISGRSQLLSAQVTDPKHQAIARLIYEQSHRLSQIITELMDFAKPSMPTIGQVNVSELLERSIYDAKALNDPADRKIELTLGDVPDVTVDPVQVGAALVEIVANALQATDPKGGLVEIHGAFDAYSNRVVITISDNGAGMDDHTLKRAFDPFFSSKPAGRRRGMGLAKTLRWIETSGGSIKLESRTNQGTRAIILLPATVTKAETIQESKRVAK